ncbi:SMI1/KNR4 family protein [Chitinimonas sp. BJB300]|uniref:SMI1/KNR4 family protein n=1 Tax=Chitinimonas sp. BJB300 TaxID=1559339 RepID=UPI000C0FC24E|nr:SMI1/KNR4 family protein [Chitinimonas sp. BJB300]PHV12240.1 SMI1/KNR4 family protein [Chitinimonas sp. BJB300]TSJ85214.1 SMI1/KNR4 family protein [Chitinimonas sp. BJB300]
MNIKSISGVAEINKGATQNELISLEVQLGNSIPSEYRTLLENANGFALKNGLIVYPTAEIFERNETFEVTEYAPGYLAIGDDSGGRAILISIEGNGVYLVDQGSMDPDEFELLSPTLSDWILQGCKLV